MKWFEELEAWVRAYPRTCAYLIIVTTINLILNVIEVLK